MCGLTRGLVNHCQPPASTFPVPKCRHKYKHPLPAADLEKFNHAPGVDRIYDSGNIIIYELTGL